MPALLTRMSTAPAAAINVSQPAAVETSAATARAPRPSCSAAAWDDAALRPLMITFAPSAARALAMAKPMPLVEPVTSAVLFSS